MARAHNTVFPTSHPLMLGRIVWLCESLGITASVRIMAIILGHPTGQDPAHRGSDLVAEAQTLAIKVKVTRGVITYSLVRVTSNKVISQDIRVIQSSSMVANTMFSPQVCVNEIIRCTSMRSMLLSRWYLSTCGGQSTQSRGVVRITCPELRIRVYSLWW